jgi:hypothetical protein
MSIILKDMKSVTEPVLLRKALSLSLIKLHRIIKEKNNSTTNLSSVNDAIKINHQEIKWVVQCKSPVIVTLTYLTVHRNKAKKRGTKLSHTFIDQFVDNLGLKSHIKKKHVTYF